MILVHGRDLFAEKKIRFLVARKYGIKKNLVPQKWISDSFSSRNFIKLIGFPTEFSGIKTEVEKKQPSEFLSKKKFNRLVDFQNEIKDQVLEKLRIRPSKFLISLPTGSGKTKVAVHSILEQINNIKSSHYSHILWLAHTEELCEQAYSCFKNTALYINREYDLRLFRYWGSYASNDIGNTTDFPYVFYIYATKDKKYFRVSE